MLPFSIIVFFSSSKLFGEAEIDNKDLSNSTKDNQNLDQIIDLENKLIVDTSLGCKKPNDSSGLCEKVTGVYVGLKKENREKLRKIQIMLRLTNYELENGYVANDREGKSMTNIRGILDGLTQVQLYSYLVSKEESINDFPFSFTVAGWKLEKKMKKKEKRKLASTIFDKVLPMLETDLKNNAVTDCTYLVGDVCNSFCSDKGKELYIEEIDSKAGQKKCGPQCGKLTNEDGTVELFCTND